MDWLKNFFDKLTGRQDEVQFVVPSGRKYEPEIEETPTFSFSDETMAIFGQFMEKGNYKQDALFFDPEEKNCYIYRLSDEEAFLLTYIPVREYNQMLPVLKAMNRRDFNFEGRSFMFCICISFTNLGERVSVLFFDVDSRDDETMKALKKKAVRLVNRLKPPTALTRGNIKNLLQMLESKSNEEISKFFDILEKEQVIPTDHLESIKKSCSLEMALSYPAPRKLIIKALAKWLDLGYFDVELSDIDENTAKKIPEEMAKKLRVIPVAFKSGVYTVAFWNPFCEESVKYVKELLGDNIITVLGCEEEIRSKLKGIHSK